jgi:methyl-accepting chemotaxis protein
MFRSTRIGTDKQMQDGHLSRSALQTVFAGERHALNTANYYRNPLWAPGVRLLSKFPFSTKALLISLMFLVPLAWVSWAYYTAQSEAIAFSEKELLGVKYNQEIFPVLDLAQQLRRDASSAAATNGSAPATISDVRSRLQTAQKALDDVNKVLGKELDTGKTYESVQAAFSQVDKATGVDAVFKAHTDYVESLISLLQTVTDNSNLTLDPDIDSFYLMDAALSRVPDVVENSGKLRGLGLAIMKAGTITAEQQRVLSDSIPIAEFQFRGMSSDLAKAYAYNPGLEKLVDSKEAIESGAAFFALARTSVVNGQVFHAENQARYLELANKTIESEYTLAKRLMTQLGNVITVRVDGIRSKVMVTELILLIGVALATYFFVSFYLISNGGLRLISGHLGEVSTGDLRNIPSEPLGGDEAAKVLSDLQLAYDALHMLIRKVRHSARALHAASGEISAASLELSSRTEAAAANLEEQAAAMEEIGSTVGSTAERAQMASTFASDNAHVAAQGGKVFDEVVGTMREIHESSSKISDIISVIDGIAFQTNILALNAAVEAARAGESGRGFAVVASEVRSLAGRSADAAREIKSLIAASVEKVESGTRVVQQAGKTMNEVVANADQINQFLSEISVACREQAQGVAEVGRAIQELDKGTQQNSALVEETASAADALTQQADVLQDEIANFRVA